MSIGHTYRGSCSSTTGRVPKTTRTKGQGTKIRGYERINGGKTRKQDGSMRRFGNPGHGEWSNTKRTRNPDGRRGWTPVSTGGVVSFSSTNERRYLTTVGTTWGTRCRTPYSFNADDRPFKIFLRLFPSSEILGEQ